MTQLLTNTWSMMISSSLQHLLNIEKEKLKTGTRDPSLQQSQCSQLSTLFY